MSNFLPVKQNEELVKSVALQFPNSSPHDNLMDIASPLEPSSSTLFSSPNSGPSFCFAAAGWLKVWYYGVGSRILCFHSFLNFCKGKAFQQRLDLSQARFAGSSAGTLVSVCLLLGVDFDKLMEFTLTCVRRCRYDIFSNIITF
jgi:hypothetical protein